jgi:hypothetical protein
MWIIGANLFDRTDLLDASNAVVAPTAAGERLRPSAKGERMGRTVAPMAPISDTMQLDV